ncbi:DMT family transporter [Galactobacter sp.]|uniref:DMT family transporter n=1 Tax=Galactobacter sp. TaxID=2676125 RepID=UPI0025B96343|nr:DMT family transporter [Galactobacter sp.]
MIVTACVLAVISALALAAGTHLQHRGVSAAMGKTSAGGTAPSLRACLRTPVWLSGTGAVVVATLLNVLALAMAPVALVQPLGVLSLVAAAVISTRTSGLRVRGPLLAGILTCVTGVIVFVSGSATVARTAPLPDDAAWALAGLLACAALAAGVVLMTRAGHLVRVAGSGVLFGLVAVSVHAVAPVLGRRFLGLSSSGAAPAPGLTATLVLVILLAIVAGLGSWMVQTAYASGPPETVLAGLTVLDPMIAVVVGAVVLHEYTLPAPGITLMLTASATAAVLGILTVVRNHPGVQGTQRNVPLAEHRTHDVTTQIARG